MIKARECIKCTEKVDSSSDAYCHSHKLEFSEKKDSGPDASAVRNEKFQLDRELARSSGENMGQQSGSSLFREELRQRRNEVFLDLREEPQEWWERVFDEDPQEWWEMPE
jgi:hypothetical protein